MAEWTLEGAPESNSMERRNPHSLKGGIYDGIWTRGLRPKRVVPRISEIFVPDRFYPVRDFCLSVWLKIFMKRRKDMKRTERLTNNVVRNAGRAMAIVLTAAMLAGCGASASETTAAQSVAQETAQASEAARTEAESTDATYTIGIGQFAEHGSLDNCREGFLAGLEEEGFVEGENLTVDYDNANADGSIATQIMQSYVGSDVDLICAIATPMAQSAYAVTRDTDIPVIYTAVTDPAAAELVKEDGSPIGDITGTSDKLPVAEQLEMIRAMLPEARVLGIMYTTSEANSESSVAEYKELASEYGFEIYELGISTQADIPLAADTMIQNVDCITMITDNTVVASLPIILEKAKAASMPVFGSEIEQVKKGCLAAMGLDYIELGKQTGRMAAKVLRGEAKAADMSYEIIEDASFYGNSEVAASLGITIPETYAEGGEIFDSIEQ